ncbi:MAG TPA: hypothetical protein VKE94_08755 [Gemmataceae bacterium]|nr:hypothetical protein [Gemmataceae bacterium]
MAAWLKAARENLLTAGFVIFDEVAENGMSFPIVARRSRFEVTKFGFSETFFVFGQFDELGTPEVREFSALAYQYAKQHKRIPLPCGLFESVWCYAVAVAKSVDERTLDSIRSETPPKHWASAEIPVIYDQSRRKLFYFEKTPLWGSAYYAGFRKQIRSLLEGIGGD